MYIKCWGCRGSIPVSGKEFLFYGGDTTCIEIRDINNNIIIIDGGTGIRELGKKIIKEKKRSVNLIFTHVHWDHIIGLPFFPPIYDKDFLINVFGVPDIQGDILSLALEVFSSPYFPVNSCELAATIKFHPIKEIVKIGDIEVKIIALSHPNGGIGLKFSSKGKRFVFLTDNELGYKHQGGKDFSDYVMFCKEADLLIHDAEYTPQEYAEKIKWGHSTLDQVVSLAIEAGVKRLGLFHHNQNRTDGEIKKMESYVKDKIKEKGHKMECFMVRKGQEMWL